MFIVFEMSAIPLSAVDRFGNGKVNYSRIFTQRETASEKQQLCTELQSDACGDGTAPALGFKYLRSSVCVFIVTSVLAVLIAATDGPCLSRKVHQLWQSLPALPASPF